jgi:histidine ammonia-lyase
MAAAIKLRRVVENARYVLAIEAMAAAQAVESLLPLKTSMKLQAAHAAVRAVSPRLEKDRVMYPDFVRIAEVIAAGKLCEVMR